MNYHPWDEMFGLEEHLRDTSGPVGDARHCPHHPHVKTSSDDGMFDGICGECEAEMDEAAARWEYDPENPHRLYCGDSIWGPKEVASLPRRGLVSCQPTAEDDIPF